MRPPEIEVAPVVFLPVLLGGMTSKEHQDRARRIRALNDAFRTAFIGGHIIMTPGVRDLPPATNYVADDSGPDLQRFNADNDPHQEHDFGSIDIDGRSYFWKIDYYDKACEYGSADPSDPAQTTRVMTIMRADEY
jgi:hypothetical protein